MIQYEAEIIELSVCSFCFRDMYEMTKYPRSWYVCKPELQRGTELRVLSVVRNFYGKFYHCAAPDGITLEGVTNPEYDIPVYNAVAVKWREKEDMMSRFVDVKIQGVTAEEAQKSAQKLAELARKVKELEE